jgi:hypothetical protein
MNQNDYKQEYFNFIDNYNFSNKQNKRYLIIGSSGSMKTSLGISLILSGDFGYKKRIIFVIGGYNTILNNLKKDFKSADIEIEIHIPENKKDLINITSNLKLGPGDLLFLDDMSHFLKSGSDFLIKIFTTSRQLNYDVILILHKFKLMNPILRMNASKIFITKIEKDMINEYPDLKNYIGQEPIVIEDGEFYGVGIENIDFKNISLDKKKLPQLIKQDTALTKIDSMIKIGNKNNEMTVKKDDPDLKNKKKPIDLKREVRAGILRALKK